MLMRTWMIISDNKGHIYDIDHNHNYDGNNNDKITVTIKLIPLI